MIELYLVWKPKIVSWIILSPTLEPIKGVYAWSTLKAKSSQDACMKCKVKPFQANTKRSWSWFKPSKCKPKTFYHDQGSSISSLKHPKWIRRSKWPNFASLHIWFATSWLILKFVCLFRVSMFLWILKIHVAFDVLCSCIYFKKFHTQK